MVSNLGQVRTGIRNKKFRVLGISIFLSDFQKKELFLKIFEFGIKYVLQMAKSKGLLHKVVLEFRFSQRFRKQTYFFTSGGPHGI